VKRAILPDGLPDLRKINPMLLIQAQKRYAAIGSDLGPAWRLGNALKPKI
jgi:hypothetical protein